MNTEQKIKGLLEVIETYESVGRGDCQNCNFARKKVEELRNNGIVHGKEEKA